MFSKMGFDLCCIVVLLDAFYSTFVQKIRWKNMHLRKKEYAKAQLMRCKNFGFGEMFDIYNY